MNPAYRSSQRWKRDSAGVYTSACGRFSAFRDGHSRWKLIKDRTVYGPYLSLAECQEIAERKARSLL